MFEERRIDPRERIELPLQLDNGASAMTRDISATGIYFEIDGEHGLGGGVDLALEFPQMSMKLTSPAQIVRIERRAGKTGVAVRLVDPRLTTLESAADEPS